MRTPYLVITLGLLTPWLSLGCTQNIPMPDLGDRYNRTAQYHGPDRNPVIVIPGILGSKLTDPATGTRVWGAFEGGAANPGTAKGARLIALPMEYGKPLREITDEVKPDGALDRVELSLFGLHIELKAYAQILGILGVGGFVDSQLGESGAIDYGSEHYTCFQFDYDWRRDNVENAQNLYAFIKKHRGFVQSELAEKYGGEAEDYDVKFDIVAHSMGGMLTRYMLRYGDADLPEDGSTPDVTWAGAKHVDRVILVGTPNAGSIEALTQLVKGANFAPFHSGYSPAILGTMPSIYQLLPRDRHHRVLWGNPEIKSNSGETETSVVEHNINSLETWEAFGWGLVNPKQDHELAKLLPDIDDPAERRAIAKDHLRKSLARAKALQDALDQPASLPKNLWLEIYAGDGVPTPDIATINAKGRIAHLSKSSGDGTVTRDSALMDERLGGEWTPQLVTPIDWTDVNFLFTNHLGLTADPVFADNILYLLLESPTRTDPAEAADVMP